MDFEFEFGETDEGRNFFLRHPNFCPTFQLLIEVTNKCFARPLLRPPSSSDYICFRLGETCREDFLEIVFLATNGYSTGAAKLVRALFERALTLAYLAIKPEKTERFLKYAVVQEHKLLNDALKTVSEDDWNSVMGADNSAEEIRKRFEEVEPEFQQTDCKTCKTKRLAYTWDLDVPSMTAKVGEPFKLYYLPSYSKANLDIHATLTSAMREDEKDKAKRRQQRLLEADFALFSSALLFVEVLRAQNTIFHLELADEIQEAENSIARTWKESIDKRGME